MPLNGNSFSIDSDIERLERLRAIQDNSANTIPLIEGIHADISAWMLNCHSAYNTLIKTAEAHTSDSESNTVHRGLVRKQLRQQLIIAKKQIKAGYANDEVRRRPFDSEGALPYETDALIQFAEHIVNLTAKHKAEGIDYHISDYHIAHLQEAIAANVEARKKGKEISADESRANVAAEQRFDSDTFMLQRLLGDWLSALKDNDPRISLIGMVNTKKGGNSGKPGIPTLAFDPLNRDLIITPDPNRPAPTSYYTEFREVGEDSEWEEFAHGSENRVPTAVALLNGGTQYEFRTQARNANGFGEWSAVILRVG